MTENGESRRGRKPGPGGGKGASFSTRITVELREALDAEAERSGRTVSEVAALWLEQARTGQAAYLERVGGTSAAIALEKLSVLSRAVAAEMGDVRDKTEAREALISAWRRGLLSALPPAVCSREEQVFQAALIEVQEGCHSALAALLSLPPDDPVRAANAVIRGDLALAASSPVANAKNLALACVEMRLCGGSLNAELERIERALAVFAQATIAIGSMMRAARAHGVRISDRLLGEPNPDALKLEEMMSAEDIVL